MSIKTMKLKTYRLAFSHLNPIRTIYLNSFLIKDTEKELIKLALQENDGNREKAAIALGIGTRSMYRKLNKYNLKEGVTRCITQESKQSRQPVSMKKSGK